MLLDVVLEDEVADEITGVDDALVEDPTVGLIGEEVAMLVDG